MKKFEKGKSYNVYTMQGDRKYITVVNNNDSIISYTYNGNKTVYNSQLFINSANGNQAFNTRYKQTVIADDLIQEVKENDITNDLNILIEKYKNADKIHCNKSTLEQIELLLNNLIEY